jgi:hypothetical protein
MRWLGRSLVLLGVVALSSCTTRLWVWSQTWTIPPVPLTSDLPRKTVEMSPAFDARVKARFSVGMPMADVGLELAREGFIRQDWAPLRTGEHFARRYDGGAPTCNLIAWVYWKADEGDRLTAIRGEYQVECL